MQVSIDEDVQAYNLEASLLEVTVVYKTMVCVSQIWL
jgi:hypothetical protein